MSLPAPPADLRLMTLRTVNIRPAKLFRVSRFASGEPHFGRTGANRFDDPSRVVSRRYAVCYFGLDLATAVAETVLHDELPVRGKFLVSQAYLETRSVVRLQGGMPLTLADLTGAALKRCGGHGGISTEMPFDTPQQWSKAIYLHPQAVDGLVYISRHLNDRRAVAIFDRATHKLGTARYRPLSAMRGFKAVCASLGIVSDAP